MRYSPTDAVTDGSHTEKKKSLGSPEAGGVALPLPLPGVLDAVLGVKVGSVAVVVEVEVLVVMVRRIVVAAVVAAVVGRVLLAIKSTRTWSRECTE